MGGELLEPKPVPIPPSVSEVESDTKGCISLRNLTN